MKTIIIDGIEYTLTPKVSTTLKSKKSPEEMTCIEDIFEALGLDYHKHVEERGKVLSIRQLNQELVEMGIKYLNEGWTPDWNDERQPKYFPVFEMRDDPGFGFFTYLTWYNRSHCGSPLALKSSQLCELAVKIMLPQYKAFRL